MPVDIFESSRLARPQNEMAGGFTKFPTNGKGRAIPTPANLLVRGDNGAEMTVYGIRNSSTCATFLFASQFI